MGILKSLRKSVPKHSKAVEEDVVVEKEAEVYHPIPSSILQALNPIQILYSYYYKTVFVNSTVRDQETFTVGGKTVALSLVGNTMYLNHLEQFQLIDMNFVLVDGDLSFDGGRLIISSTSPALLQKLYRNCLISCSQLMLIGRNLTGVLISSVGLHMNDIHYLLNSKSKYEFKDWCFIRPVGDPTWIKVWCQISRPSSSKKCVKFYDTNTGDKSLLALVEPDAVSDVFVFNSSYDEDPFHYMNSLTTIQILGTAKLASSGIKESSASRLGKKKSVAMNEHQHGLLIKPIPHHGISHLDTLVRMIIPIIDCMNKYGRPTKLRFSREDPESLMFALPRLPNYKYLSDEQLDYLVYDEAVNQVIDELQTNARNSNELAIELVKKILLPA